MITFGIRFFQMLRYVNERFVLIYNNPDKPFDFGAYNYKYKNFSAVVLEDNYKNLERMGEVYESCKKKNYALIQ